MNNSLDKTCARLFILFCAALLVAAMVGTVAFLLMLAWNYTLPVMLSNSALEITYFQALMLLLLTRILLYPWGFKSK